MNTRTMASATLVASAGFTITPVSRAKSWWPVMPPSARRNQTPGSTPKPSFTSTAWKPMSLVSSSTGMSAGAVEGDVELARQAVERALVEDVEVPFARVGPGVDQLLRIDAGGRRAGDVADVVGAGAARAQAEVLDRLDHGDRVLRLDLAQLGCANRRSGWSAPSSCCSGSSSPSWRRCWRPTIRTPTTTTCRHRRRRPHLRRPRCHRAGAGAG